MEDLIPRLNPGGVRLGTAEIYNEVEKIKEIQESIVNRTDHGKMILE